mgnify:CR=1 FL=1
MVVVVVIVVVVACLLLLVTFGVFPRHEVEVAETMGVRRHGRDNKLIVWKLGVEDESRMSTSPPLDPVSRTRPQPEMLHLLEVNTMNFCSFSHCPEAPVSSTSSGDILVAVPNTLASEAVRLSQAIFFTQVVHTDNIAITD